MSDSIDQLGLDFEPPPFRTELRTATKAEIEAINRQEGRTGALKYEDLERIEERIDLTATPRQPFSRQRLLSWVTHPHERVPYVIAKNDKKFNLELNVSADGEPPEKAGGHEVYSPEHKRLATHLVNRAIRDADEEGVAWTPLLDAIYSIYGEDGTRVVFRTPAGNLEHFNHISVPDREAEERFERLRAWVHEQTDPRQLERLLAFEAAPIRRMVATESPVMDEVLAKTLMRERLGGEAMRNPAFPEASAREVYEATMRRFNRYAGMLGEHRAEAGSTAHEPRWHRPHGELAPLDEGGHTIPRDVADRLLDVATDRSRGDGMERTYAAEGLLGMTQHTSLRVIEKLFASDLPWREPALIALAKNPNLPADRLRWVAREAADRGVADAMTAVARRRGAAQDPEILAEFRRLPENTENARTHKGAVIAGLLDNCTPSNFGRLLGEYASLDLFVGDLPLERLATRPRLLSIQPADVQAWDSPQRVLNALVELDDLRANHDLILYLAETRPASYWPSLYKRCLDEWEDTKAVALIDTLIDTGNAGLVLDQLERLARLRALVTPEQVAALLASPNGQVRMRAVTLLSNFPLLRPRAQGSPPEPGRQAPPTAPKAAQ